MRILINFENTDEFREIYIEETELLENLKYIIEAELNIPFLEQIIKYEGKILKNDEMTMKQYNVKEDEIVIVSKICTIPTGNNSNISSGFNMSKIFDDTMNMIKTNNAPSIGGGQGNIFGNIGLFSNNVAMESQIKTECKNMKEKYFSNPDQLQFLFSRDPELAEAIVSMNDHKLEGIVRGRIQLQHDKKKKEIDEHMKLMNSNPDDPDAQRKIEEIINQKNIDENYKMAEEYLPETLMQVHMLFINLEINKNNVVALVDTGAQTTIISESLAKKCGVFNLCDTRFAGIAKGVGTSKILGVIHAAQMKIGDK